MLSTWTGTWSRSAAEVSSVGKEVMRFLVILVTLMIDAKSSVQQVVKQLAPKRRRFTDPLGKLWGVSYLHDAIHGAIHGALKWRHMR